MRASPPLRPLSLLVLLLALIAQQPAPAAGAWPAATPVSLATPQAADDRPLDLAWAAPTGADLAPPGYGALSSGYRSISGYFRRLGAVADDPGAVAQAGATWRQTYEGWLALPDDDDPDAYARVVHTLLVRHRDPAGAGAGFAAVLAGQADFGRTLNRTDPAVGEQARALHGTDTDGRDGRSFASAVVVFQAGEVVAEVEVRDYTGDAPATSVAIALAKGVERRLGEAVAGRAPELSLALPRPQDDGVDVSNDRYVWRDGRLAPYFDQSPASQTTARAFRDDRDIVDHYAYSANWTDPAKIQPGVVNYSATAYGFADDAAAERYVATEPEDWRERIGEPFRDIGPVEPMPGIGDGAAVVSFALEFPSGEIARGYQGWARVGSRATWVSTSAVPGLPRAATEAILRRAAACLQRQCAAPESMADLFRMNASPAIPDVVVAEPVDPGWVAVVPSDLGADYGFTDLARRGAEDYADQIVSGADAEALARDLQAAGWRLGYASVAALPSPEDPDYFQRVVRATVSHYESEAGASAALARLRDALEAEDYGAQTAAPAIGDEAAALRARFRGASSGRSAEALRVLVRHGAVVVDLGIIDWTDDAPATSEIVGLAKALLARLDEAQQGRSGGLSGAVARLEGSGFEQVWDGYGRRSAVSEPDYRQSAASLRQQDEEARASAVLDEYFYRARWTDPTREGTPAVAIVVDVLRFPDADAAGRYLNTAPREQVASAPSAVQGARIVGDARKVGDESLVVGYTVNLRDGSSVPGYTAWVRVGDRVARVEIDGRGVDQADLEEALGRQAGCLSSTDCWAPATSPGFPDDGAPQFPGGPGQFTV